MCAGYLASITNNLTRFPEVAAQLDIAANGGVTPERVVAGTSRMLWWIWPHNSTHRWSCQSADSPARRPPTCSTGRYVSKPLG